jgi:effector-binding domain-containing protein
VSKKTVWWIVGIGAALLLGAALWGPIASNVERPKYKIAERSGDIEIRDYAPMIVAETEVKGERREAIGKGFRLIADYIFGNNAAAQKVPMTAPVTQQGGEKIAMTAPVTQQGGGGDTWRVRFVMPARYTIETLPKPNNPAVELKEIPEKRFAVIRFSGMAGAESLERHTKALQDFLSAKKLAPLSPPTYAFYNPPWTLPFLRRNEVMVEIAGPIHQPGAPEGSQRGKADGQ